MSENDSHTGDDAPLSTSKSSDTVDRAAVELLEANGGTLVGRTVTINRPRAELFAYWRDFSRLPTFMDNVVSVETLDATRSHWVVRAPAGRTVECCPA